MQLKKNQSFWLPYSVLFMSLCYCRTPDGNRLSLEEPVFNLPLEKKAISELDYEAKRELEALEPFQAREENPFDFAPWIGRPEVQKWIEYFVGKGRSSFIQQLNRGERLRGLVESILLDNGLPTDLYYLALIESGFEFKAKSFAQAVGLWQFVEGTGKRYGLRINSYVDERQDPVRATVAAASYMGDLYRVFQSWTLALAAYSTGEGRVLGAVMRHGTRNYWELLEKKALPRETCNYVPKFIAAAWIAKNWQDYNFPPVEEVAVTKLQGVKVSGGVALSDIAELTQVPLSQIKILNPHLLKEIVPPGNSSYSLWLPQYAIDKEVEIKLVALSPKSVRATRSSKEQLAQGPASSPKQPASSSTLYHVRRGDTLSSIAKQFQTTVALLKTTNRLQRSALKVGQKLYLPEKLAVMPASSKKLAELQYRVQPGDTLSNIARKFASSVSLIKEHNELERNMIFPGQVLSIPQDQDG